MNADLPPCSLQKASPEQILPVNSESIEVASDDVDLVNSLAISFSVFTA